MPSGQLLSDDYIAHLLAQDAKSIPLPKRPTLNAPKPNTRFLKNIIKETDSHNAALRAREEQEARARLRDFRGGDVVSSGPKISGGWLSNEEHHSAKRRRVEVRDGGKEDRPSLRSERESENANRKSRSHHHHRNDNDKDISKRTHHHRHHHHHHRDHRRHRSVEQKERGRHSEEHDSRRLSRSRSRSRNPEGEHHHHYHRSRRRSSTSPSTIHDSNEPSRTKTRPSQTSMMSSKALNSYEYHKARRNPSPASDSDPLEAIIGPPPPPPAPKVQARGRGTFASSSAMDSHFSSTYDPSIDVQPNPDHDDDWDQALEALRDRQRWQKQGAERLKAAGFTEEEVHKWEKGGEKREEDVCWRGRGERREWDRGKVVGEDDGDDVETRPEWGRLKGT